MREFYNISQKLKDALSEDEFIHVVTFGEINETGLSKQVIYPLAHIVPGASEIGERTITIDFQILLCDLVDVSKNDIRDEGDTFHGINNLQDVFNQMLAVANRLVQRFQRGDIYTENYKIETASLDPFMDRFDNLLAGWILEVSVEVPNEIICIDTSVVDIPAPSQLSSSVAGSNIVLSWTDNSSTETGFKLYRSFSPIDNYSLITTTTANVDEYTDTDVSADVTYFYKVRAFTSDGVSAFSNIVGEKVSTGGSSPIDISLNSTLVVEDATTNQDIAVEYENGSTVGSLVSGVWTIPDPIDQLSVNFSADETNPAPDVEITFTATGDVGSGFIHVWNFGDGTETVVFDVATVDHTYTVEDQYTVTLRVLRKSDNAAGIESKVDYIDVEATYSPFIDELTAIPQVAWSVWKAGSGQTNCVRLRRDSDNAESDFGFTSLGLVDTAAITTWAAGANLYVVTLYMWDGSKTATEATSGEQFQWFNSGGVDNKPYIAYENDGAATGDERYILSSAITSIVDYTAIQVNDYSRSSSTTSYLWTTTNAYRGYQITTGTDGLQTRPSGSALIGGSGTVVNPSETVIEFNRASGTVTGYVDNSSVGTAANSDNTTISHIFGNGVLYKLSELLFFKESLGVSDRNTYYAGYNTRYNKAI